MTPKSVVQLIKRQKLSNVPSKPEKLCKWLGLHAEWRKHELSKQKGSFSELPRLAFRVQSWLQAGNCMYRMY